MHFEAHQPHLLHIHHPPTQSPVVQLPIVHQLAGRKVGITGRNMGKKRQEGCFSTFVSPAPGQTLKKMTYFSYLAHLVPQKNNIVGSYWVFAAPEAKTAFDPNQHVRAKRWMHLTDGKTLFKNKVEN